MTDEAREERRHRRRADVLKETKPELYQSQRKRERDARAAKQKMAKSSDPEERAMGLAFKEKKAEHQRKYSAKVKAEKGVSPATAWKRGLSEEKAAETRLKQNAYFKEYNAKKRIAAGRPERVFHEGKGWKTYKNDAAKVLKRKPDPEELKVLRQKWKEEYPDNAKREKEQGAAADKKRRERLKAEKQADGTEAPPRKRRKTGKKDPPLELEDPTGMPPTQRKGGGDDDPDPGNVGTTFPSHPQPTQVH